MKTAFCASCFVAVVTPLLAGCGGGAAAPSQVASAAGATSCDNSGFYIQSKLTGEKDVVYDCRFPTGLPRCVTYRGNIASDASEEVSLLFQGSLNSSKPACLKWRSQALARRAAIAARKAAQAAAARNTARQALMGHIAREPWHRGYAAYESGESLVSDTETAGNGQTYTFQVPNIYYRFVQPANIQCASYATNGCWQVQVITRNGCPNGLTGQLGVLNSNNVQIGTLYGSSGATAPQQASILEFDADTGSAGSEQGQLDSLSCF